MEKAIVIFNFGAPENEKEIFPYQIELFNDPDIIDLPIGKVGRLILSYLIAFMRKNKSKERYRLIGGASPLNKITEEQRSNLEKYLKEKGENVKVFAAQKYLKPDLNSCLSKIKAQGIREITFIPLFPHYSKVTTGGFWRKLDKIKDEYFCFKKIDSYYKDPLFIEAWVFEIEKLVENIPSLKDHHLLFSAHGLPEKLIKMKDPYKNQIEATVRAVMSKLKYCINHSLSYQSRSGPGKWISPSTTEVIKDLAEKGKNIILVPISFVSENFETLYENDIEFATIYFKSGGKDFKRVPALNSEQRFIKCLGELYLNDK